MNDILDDGIVRFAESVRSPLDEDEHDQYYEKLKLAFELLLDSYQYAAEDIPREIPAVRSFLVEFLNTLQLLRLKFLFAEDVSLEIDRANYGFPHYQNIVALDRDIEVREEKLEELSARKELRRQIVDQLIEKQSHPYDLLHRHAKRTFYEEIGEEDVFQQFTLGQLVPLRNREEEGRRDYFFAWAIFDDQRNCPVIHLLLFSQSTDVEPLHESQDNFTEFLSVLRDEASRFVRQLKLIASSIDRKLASIHPKYLKRITIGPFISAHDTGDHELSNLLENEQFALEFETEVIRSVGERKSSGMFQAPQVMQEFAVSSDDIEELERKVSEMQTYLLAPHSLTQRIHAQNLEYLEDLDNSPITFNKDGEIHGSH